MKNLHILISDWLRNYIESTKLNCFIVGISGGIDSALTSTLCAMTNKKTLLISMPINQSNEQLKRAKDHIDWMRSRYSNVESLEIDLTNIFDNFKSIFPDSDELSLVNTKSRLRMVTLYQISSMFGGLVVGTGNKIEDFGIGFFTKYGDGGVDISPIADLTKTQVFELSKNIGILDDIIRASPTDGLWSDNRTDEDQIGASYKELEWAMEFNGQIESLSDRQLEVLLIYTKLKRQNSHKMNPIPIYKLDEK
jgi:NAD+ synthase